MHSTSAVIGLFVSFITSYIYYFGPQTPNLITLIAIFGPKMQMSTQETQIVALAIVSILTKLLH